jgi:hypothetical protein
MVLGTHKPCDGLAAVKEILNFESHYLRINFASIETKGFTPQKMNSFTGYLQISIPDSGTVTIISFVMTKLAPNLN